MTPSLAELILRLRGRADTSRNNARTYESSGYPGEALLARERAKAFDLAAEDAEAVAAGAGPVKGNVEPAVDLGNGSWP